MKKVHFIGIAGIGMASVAMLMKEAGWEVSGSDEGFYPPTDQYLRDRQIPFVDHYDAANIPPDVSLIVIGKNAKLVPETNPEVARAMDMPVPKKSFADILSDLTKDTHNIIAAGSWGKSTCAGLLTWCLHKKYPDLNFFIGAVPLNDLPTAHFGGGKYFVLEGDEYPASNTDPRSKFLSYHPTDILLTSAAHDHVNVFPTHEAYQKPFQKLLSLVPSEGHIVACEEEDTSAALSRAYPRTHTYGVHGGMWHAADIRLGAKSSFTLMRENTPITTLTTTLLGTHNIQNIVGTAALLLGRSLLTPDELAERVASFKGMKRRLDLLTTHSRVPAYEGFGSSYEKARAGIEALRAHFPARKIILLFEPHTFSWRNRNALSWYDDVFAGVDHVLIYEPATQGAETHKQLTQDDIVERVRKSGVRATPITSAAEGLREAEKLIDEQSVVLLSTSGNLDGLTSSIPRALEERFPT